MAASNYADVLDQLRAAGLLVDHIEAGRLVRCHIDGDREKRGWYMLHELHGQNGDLLLVGSYGVWHGQDNGAQKITLSRAAFSAEQREAIRKRLADDRRRAEREREKIAARAADRAAQVWSKCLPTGESPYLIRKGVNAHGLRFSPSGACVVPMLDTAGKIHGLQVIRPSKQGGRDKDFFPPGMAKKGHFHLIGSPGWIVLVAEGYATAASLHEATGLPVAVAFDAGNLAPVVDALHKRYRLAKILVCADDDHFAKCPNCGERIDIAPERDPSICPKCGNEHGRTNTGVLCASAAALSASGSWLAPVFGAPDAVRAEWISRGNKLTDFNDLHLREGLHAVRAQVEAHLSAIGWSANTSRQRASSARGAGEGDITPFDSLDELLDRFALVYGQGGLVFDGVEHCMVMLSDMRDACITRELHRAWCEHPERKIVRAREVGFDPSGRDTAIKCNLWAGWPTTPKSGNCDKLLELLHYMCSADGAPATLYRWVLNWLAYPIQHPGAKLKTTLVLHGPQGTGKNLFFEAIMAIYGEYGRVIDQGAIEDKFTDWASRKLFLIADEVIARSDLYHIKNKLKAFITGEWIRINFKNKSAYDERNHVNVVFLSNEAVPVILEDDDRRHAVIWTPEKLGPDFYREVMHEIDNGGIAALHHYLLHHDCGDFGPGTLPPYTDAKDELIKLSLDSTIRFHRELMSGELHGVKPRVALATDYYDLYRVWCARTGQRAGPMPRLINAAERKCGVTAERKRYLDAMGTTKGPHSVLFLDDTQCPPGTSEQSWLGEQIDAFRKSVGVYRGDHYD